MQSASVRVAQCTRTFISQRGFRANSSRVAEQLSPARMTWQPHPGARRAAHHQAGSRLVAPPRAGDDAADALTETLSGLSNSVGRISNTTNMIMGGDNSLESWRELDEKVNQYPTERSFKAIGMGGQAFVDSMVNAVASAVGGEVQPGRVQQRPSAQGAATASMLMLRILSSEVHPSRVQQGPSAEGKYVSVTIGPVMMESSDQVVKVYAEMREDQRLKWYL